MRSMQRVRGRAGYSLAELLAVLALLGLVLAAIVPLFQSGLAHWAVGAARVEAQQSARVALERMARELREAGYDPTESGLAAIVVAEPTRVVFQRDLNGNGIVDPTRERVSYRLGGTTLRRDAGGGAQPVIDGVRALALTYLDRAGVPTTDPAAVRAIRIHLDVSRAGSSAVMQTQAVLRNDRLPASRP